MYNLYGNYRTRTFSDIFESATDFYNWYYDNRSTIPNTISETNCKTLWALLYSKYGNNTIKSSDENRFKFQVLSIIFQYGPTWEKKLAIQQSLRSLTDAEIKQGTTSIYSSGINPSTKMTDAEVDSAGINSYSKQRFSKSPVDAYAMLYGMLENDVTEEFINRFVHLFRQVALPDMPLLYENPDLTEEQ